MSALLYVALICAISLAVMTVLGILAGTHLRKQEEADARTRGQRCETCRYFIDHTDTEPDDEMNGYCCAPGNSDNAYGGMWTHTRAWCRFWTGLPELRGSDVSPTEAWNRLAELEREIPTAGSWRETGR
jgi:hypothetical protein